MPIFTTAAMIGVGLAASVIGTGLQIRAGLRQEKAAKSRFEATTAARRRAQALQTRKDNITAARSRQRSAAERRRFSGQAINLAVNRGAGGTIGAQGSTIPGVLGNLQQQFASGQLFQNQLTEANQGIRTAFSDAQTAATTPLPGASVAGAAFSAFGSLAISAGKSGIFGGSSPTGPTGSGISPTGSDIRGTPF
jgi:hypothetical protein